MAPGKLHAGVDIARFRTPMTMDGLLGLESTEALFPLQLWLGTHMSYAERPLAWYYASQDAYASIIDRQLQLDVSATLGLFHNVDLGVVLPFLAIQDAPKQNTLGEHALSGSGFGDVRIMPRITLAQERTVGIGVAVIGETTVPTGNASNLQGERTVSFRPRAIVSIPMVRGKTFLRALAGLGYVLRQNATFGNQQRLGDAIVVGDELLFHVGAELGLNIFRVPVRGMLELAGGTSASSMFSEGNGSPLELLGGVRIELLEDLWITVGAGWGITRGIGTPAYRILAGLAWAPRPKDSDKDGFPNVFDKCPKEPEDYDGFADTDGCPDLDNDRDLIPDLRDQCPLEPEDKNNIEDDDGCPEQENFDLDEDGIEDMEDECPADAEDHDGFEDEDGCPDYDHDHDGVMDEFDDCLDEKETINGIEDDDGCPDDGEGVTEYVEDEKIEIHATILFESGRSTIQEESTFVLDQVALQIIAHVEIPHIRIEGHTDDVGDAQDNLILSQDRADAVRLYLISKGVRKERLTAAGYGEERPVASNETSEGRAENRRVEFVIVESQ